ncbi:hypothetical protein [Burkholderia cepacia]|uniref:DotM C-terminal cytoplasmic domain-containing protein n=2 Tax=Burkholderia cepacia TaxID=292 RepID=A0AAX2RRS3_BURCE|nr:hypothetical protein [Burkholderia cepacia]TET01650.1 hypothetical protein E3D36_16580 [Burkholderia cepacia]TEU47508.1 hypothetical protein E3D37_16010 [Burkholderia cepacia]TEU53535.1 hypothetical protein E3D38_12400 [Burkholderia cepacia]TEV02141.1 hypothetical protein E3D40_13330 [Burkholderia cepacia]TEV07952.1 hypothetical protein E3D44_19330 [Burkholderia cepacia]
MTNTNHQNATRLGPLSFMALCAFLVTFFNVILWLISHDTAVKIYASALLVEARFAWVAYWLGRLVLPIVALLGFAWWVKTKLDKKKHPLAWLPVAACGAVGAGAATLMLLVLARPSSFAEPDDLLFSLNTMLANPKAVAFSDIATFAGFVGRMYWPFLITVAAIYSWRGRTHPRNKYRFAHNMESFLAEISQVFKATVPILHLNPIDKEIKGFEPSRSAAEYCRHHKLLRKGAVDLKQMKQIFREELSSRFPWRTSTRTDYRSWTYDLSKLEPWQQAIFAVLAACIAKDKDEGQALRDALNESARGSGTPNYALALPLLEKYGQHEAVRKVIAGHLYVRTALFQMFVSVREWTLDLHPAQFIWLKPADRAFWYAQHTTPLTLDRKDFAANAEGMAIIAQWQCERVALDDGGCMHPGSRPCFVSAAYGLCRELFNVGAISDAEWERLQKELPEIFFDFEVKSDSKSRNHHVTKPA